MNLLPRRMLHALSLAETRSVVIRAVQSRRTLWEYRRTLERVKRDLTGIEFKVASHLAESFDHRREGCITMYRGAIASACGCTIRSVSRALKTLVALGLLVVASGKPVYAANQFLPAFGLKSAAPIQAENQAENASHAQNVPPDPPNPIHLRAERDWRAHPSALSPYLALTDEERMEEMRRLVDQL